MDEGNEQTADWLKRNSRLKDARAPWETTWQQIAEMTAPRKAGITQIDYTPNNQRDAALYDTTAKVALERSVAGFMSWTTSKTESWFTLKPVLAQRDSIEVQSWLRNCADILIEEIANSNFYAERHEALYDKWAFGTDCLFSWVSPDKRLRFEKVRIGSYVFETDSDGKPTCLMREIELTAKQAKEKFTEEELPKCVRDCLEKGGDSDKKFTFLHVVEKRDESKVDSTSPIAIAKRKAYLSAYVEMQSKKIVQEGGFDSFPFQIGRFLKWDAVSNGSDVWGYGPGFTLLPEARQMNFMAKMIDCYMEKAVFPPILVPENFDGELKTSPRSIIYYPQNMQPNGIQPLNTVGDFTIALERMKVRTDQINQAVFTDLFQLFSMNAARGREMTAYEANLINSEKLDAISPAFDRDSSEVIDPLIRRVFNLCAENGMLPMPPPEAVVQENGYWSVKDPVVTQNGRLAIALDMRKLRADDNLIQVAAQLAAVDPTVMDAIDTLRYIQQRAIISQASPSIMRKPDEIAAIRQQRAQAQKAAQAAELASQMGGVVKDVGGVQQAKELIGQ